jgi:hypothetical protein
MTSRGSDGANGNEMHISIWAKVSQVSDVARRPLVCYYPVTVSEQILPHMNIRISLPIKGRALLSSSLCILKR